jgi:hypothetical protein
MDTPPSAPVKQNAAERRRRSVAEGRALVAAWESSGLSLRAFSIQRGVRPQRIAYWRLRLAPKARDESPATQEGAFVQVPTMAPRPSAGCVVEWPDGMRLHVGCGMEPAVLRSVVAALRDPHPAAC